MKYARVETKDSGSYTDNYFLDEVLDTLNAFGISNEDEKNNDLIKRLTIEKIECARRLMAYMVAKYNLIDNDTIYRQMDSDLQIKITELGGKPTKKTFL
jgi:hypothetical protein